jgi:predicted NBD/HSP70 family sugar kinase
MSVDDSANRLGGRGSLFPLSDGPPAEAAGELGRNQSGGVARPGSGSHRSLIGMNSATIRASNRSAVFEAIRHYAPISRKALAAQSGLNPATVTHIVDDLLAADLVVEETVTAATGPSNRPRSGSPRPAGRKPTGLVINANARYLIGLDLTRTRTTVVVTNLAAELLFHDHITVSLSHSAEMGVNRVLDLVAHAIEQSGVPHARLSGIGVGGPGPLNIRTGTIMASTFEGWGNVPLKRLLEERFALPVTIDNDANTAALAEQWFGAGREVANFAYVAVDVGVGAGIIVDGHLFQGGGDLNPEFGHTSIQADGPRCACGNRGCLELFASTPQLVLRTIEAIQQGHASSLAALVPKMARRPQVPPDPLHEDYDALTPQQIWSAVEEEDALATAVVGQTCEYLATGLANLVAIFHPSVIFIGHDMAQAGPRTFAILRAAVLRRAVAPSIRVLPAEIGAEAPAVGAVTLALRELFATMGI